MGLPLVSRLPEEYGPPSISVSGPDGAFNMYDLQRQIGPRIRSNSISPFTDTLSWQAGRHFLKFGGEVDYRGVTFGQARAPRGPFTFDGTYTGSAAADFLLGYIRSDNINPTHTNTDLYNYWYGFFVNDDWKVTSRLTMTLGLRYDYFQRYKQKDDKFVNIELNGFHLGKTVTPKTSQYGRELMAPDGNNFGPRFGFAWRPRIAGETVVRGGYGIYYTPQISNAIFAMAEGAQATAGATVTGNIVGAPNVFFSNPFPSSQTAAGLPFAVSNDQNMRDSYIQQWNFNIQRKLPGNVVLDVGYVGSKGTRLIVTFGDLNRPIVVVDPRTAGLASLNARRPDQEYLRAVTGDKSVGNSIYHSLQVKAERRLSSGLTFLTAYTWSKSISGSIRYRRPGWRRELHRLATGSLQPQRRAHRLRLRCDAAFRADRSVRCPVRAPPAWAGENGARWMAGVDDHDIPKRLPRSGHLRRRHHRHWHRVAAGSGDGPARRSPRRSADVETLVQHGGLRSGALRPFRNRPAHRCRSLAGYRHGGFLDEQALPPRGRAGHSNSGRSSSTC